MPTTIRQQVVTALDTLFKTIKTTAGYQTNLGNNVFWWRDTPLQISELPGLNCRDISETTVRAIGQHEHILTVQAVISLESADAGETVRKEIADITKALGTNVSPNVCLGGYAEDIDPPNSELIEVEHAGIKSFGMAVNIRIQYATLPFDPYTQA
jgi:hypothetical protein